MFLKKSKKLKKYSRKSKKVNSRKIKYIKKIQKGGQYGTISNPTFPTDRDKELITLVINADVKGSIPDARILAQERLDISDINTYQELCDKIQKILDKYGYYLFEITNQKMHKIYDNPDFKTELLQNKCIIIKSVIKTDPDKLSDIIFNTSIAKYIYMLSAKKPVANTTGVGSQDEIVGQSSIIQFCINWKKFTEQEKIDFIRYSKTNKNTRNNFTDDRIELGICVSNNSKEVIFYSNQHFRLLCSIFGYSLDAGLSILLNGTNDRELAFIYIAFGDLTDIKITVDKSDVDFAKEQFKPEFMPLFEEYKRRCQSDPELAQPGGWE
jgi:hypothetical protein